MQSILCPNPSGFHQHRPVEAQCVDRRAADRRSADDARGGGAPAEMIVPAIRTGIEEGYNPPSTRTARAPAPEPPLAAPAAGASHDPGESVRAAEHDLIAFSDQCLKLLLFGRGDGSRFPP